MRFIIFVNKEFQSAIFFIVVKSKKMIAHLILNTCIINRLIRNLRILFLLQDLLYF